MAWPSIINPSYVISGGFSVPVVRTSFEGPYVHTRKRYSSGKMNWVLNWPSMTAADFSTFKSYFETTQGASDTWTHPETAVSYTIRFSDDNFQHSQDRPNFFNVTVGIEEV